MRKRGFSLIELLVVVAIIAGLVAMKPLPDGFNHRVEQGWLPKICARQGNPKMPKPITRDWANPRSGAPVRVLFICSSYHQYEALSIARSFDFECDILPIWPTCSWKENNADPDTMNLLRYYLGKRKYDVIVMASAQLSALPDDCERKISQLIRNKGVGFVYALSGIFPREPDRRLKPSVILDPLIPIVLDTSGYKELTDGVIPAGNHYLSRGSDFSRIQWATNMDATVAQGAMAILVSEKQSRVLAAAATHGKGRVVAYNRCYHERTSAYPLLPMPRSVTASYDEQKEGKQSVWLNGIEYADQFFNWLGRTILWVSQKTPTVTLDKVEITAGRVSIKIRNTSNEKRSCWIKRITRDSYNSHQKVLHTKITVLPQSLTEHHLPLPPTKYLGRHMLDVFLLDNDKKSVIDWSSCHYKPAGTIKVYYKEDFKLYGPADEVKLPLKIKGVRSSGKGMVHTELFDLEERLLFDRNDTLNVGDGEVINYVVSIPLKQTGISSRLGNLRITISTINESVEIRDQLFIKQSPQWDSAHIMAYAVPSFSYLHPSDLVMVDMLKKTGHDTLQIGYPTPTRMRFLTETGLRPMVNWIKRKETVRWLKKFSPVMYEIQDEPELQFTPAIEKRFSSSKDISRFQLWLKEKYGTLASLNAVWNKRYAKWQEVERVLWHEVVDSDNWAPWFDSRRDLDTSFTERFGLISDAIRSEDPDRLCSINPRSITTMGGCDLRAMTRKLGAMSMYTDFCAREPMGFLHLGSRWVNISQSVIGYSWPSSPGIKRITREAWDALRHGVKNIAWFAPFCDEIPPLGRFSYLNGDLTPNAKGRAIAVVNQQIMSGPAQVAAATKPLNEGVFIYYPRTLFYTQTLAHMKRQLRKDPSLDRSRMTGLGPWRKNQLPCSFIPHLRSLGYQFEFGDEKDLTTERLKRTRIVFLSNVICLGKRELSLLWDFVDNGGCIVAEAGTARRDNSGIVYKKTPEAFREIFGVERTHPNLSPLVESDKVVPYDAKLVKWVSLQLGATYRKGKVFYLDFRIPTTFEATVALKRILDQSNVKPTYYLRNNYIQRDSSNLTASLVVRQRGRLAYLFLTGDGNSYDDGFRIELPKTRHVYEMLSGRTLRTLKRIEGSIDYGQAKIFALSPSPVTSFTSKLSKSSYEPGERVNVTFDLTTGDGNPGDRLVYLDQDGARNGRSPAIPKSILLAGGKGAINFVIPLNTSPGIMKLLAKDMTSGATSIATFVVKYGKELR